MCAITGNCAYDSPVNIPWHAQTPNFWKVARMQNTPNERAFSESLFFF